jgi:hypothetical protein
MLVVRRIAVIRTAFALAITAALVASASGTANDPDEGILLDSAFQTISAESVSGLLAMKLANLAELDPDHPLALDRAKQTLSMFGREDLIASSSKNYAATHCAARMPAANILDEIARRARQTSIVIVNESHERSEGRGFTTTLAVRLRPLGYDSLALEALQNNPSTTPKQYQPPFARQPDLPYFDDDDGFYVGEAAFGRMGRRVKALGYRLVSYEANPNDGLPSGATLAQRTAVREEEQAANLTAFLKEHPGTKLLVHVGYQHVLEVPRADGSKRMAALLKEKTGIDPLTISQTDCRGGGEADRLAVLPADQPTGSFDLVVDHPTARFDRGRPIWREKAGDRPVSVPAALRPSTGWRVIEARPLDEPVTSVPMDRVAIRPKEDVALMLPPGRYRLRAIDVTWSNPKAVKPTR